MNEAGILAILQVWDHWPVFGGRKPILAVSGPIVRMHMMLSYCTDGQDQSDVIMVSFGGSRGLLPNLERKMPNAEYRTQNAKQETKSPKQAKPVTIIES